jgi:hypothetical protein
MNKNEVGEEQHYRGRRITEEVIDKKKETIAYKRHQ